MSFRRIPFQFSTTNPADRQSELMRRFGVPSEEKMFTEPPSSPFMFYGSKTTAVMLRQDLQFSEESEPLKAWGTEPRTTPVMDYLSRITDALSHSSPRLQHRLPGFLGNDVQQSKASQGCAENVDLPKAEPKVRIVPIRIEGQVENQDRHRTSSESASVPIVPVNNLAGEEHARQRVNSGSSIPSFDSHKINSAFFSHRKPEEQSSAEISEPEAKVCNIPINVESDKSNKGRKLSHSRTVPLQKEASKRSASNMGNGPCLSKSANEPPADEMKEDKRQKTDIGASMKQIETILKEFKSFEEGVDEFSDIQNVKRYRYLDEMLTRCMLKLDDIETFGNEEVRKARKAAVKRVQDSINVLDSKVQSKPNESEQVEDKGKELAKGDELSPIEATAADVVMAECTTESQTSMNGDISENKPNLDEVPDSATMEVEVSEKTTDEKADCEVKSNVESENAVSSENTTMLIAVNGSEEAPKSSDNINEETVEEVNEETLSSDVNTTATCTDLDSLKDSCMQHTSEMPVMDSNKSEASSKDCTIVANGQLVLSTDENSQNTKLEANTKTENENLHVTCVQVPITSDSLHPAVNDVDMKDVEHENEVAAQS